jgi:predicted DNA-binding transcriptional regulator YafY
MRSEAGYSAPIASVKEGRRVYYRYDPIDYSILKQPLNEAEQEQVRLALETLGRIKGMPQLEWLNTVQTKLNAGLGLDSVSVPVISFEENEFLKGVEYLDPLYQFINHKRVLQISYQGYKQENPEIQTIHPYYLKQYNNRWFLFGWNNALERLQNMALDRINNIIENNEVIYQTCNIDFEEYFEDIVGVSNPEDLTVSKVVIELSSSIVPYILSKPIHGSQIIRDNILYLNVKLNYELESLILSYGEHMIVKEPEQLKKKLQKRIYNMTANY